METSVWAGVAMLYGLAPLAVFCGILYSAHYHAKGKGMRIFLYLTGGGGALASLSWLIYATIALS